MKKNNVLHLFSTVPGFLPVCVASITTVTRNGIDFEAAYLSKYWL